MDSALNPHIIHESDSTDTDTTVISSAVLFPVAGESSPPGSSATPPEQSIVSSTRTVFRDEQVTMTDTEPIPYEGRILEAVGTSGREWDVIVIETGVSSNGIHYPSGVLQEATPLYRNVPVYADHDHMDSHLPERSVRDKVGVIKNPQYGTHQIGGQSVEGIKARLTVVAPWLRESLREAMEAGEPDFYGLSHTISPGAPLKSVNIGGRQVRELSRIGKVHSVDVVTTPSAGGRFAQLVASDRPETGGFDVELTQEELNQLIKDQVAAQVAANIAQQQEAAAQAAAEATKAAEETARVAAAEAAAEAEKATATTAVATADPVTEALRQEMLEWRIERRVAKVEKSLMESAVSPAGRDQIRERYAELATRRDIEDGELRAAITKQVEYEAGLMQGASNPKVRESVRMGSSDADNFDLALQGFFSRQPLKDAAGNTVKPFSTLQEAYCRWTNTPFWEFDAMTMVESFSDFGATKGYDSQKHHKIIRESLTTSTWAQVFADVFYLSMFRDYTTNPYQDWRYVITGQPQAVPDFRTRHWARTGGYADLGTVAEGQTYPLLTTPGDEEVTWTIAKRGGIDDVTMEALLGDRVNKVQQLPREMAYAASRTLYKFVLNMVTTDNPTMDYDSVALYDAAHANTGTTALSIAGFNSVEVAMRSQTRFGTSSEILGTRNLPKIVIVPNELEERAKRIFAPSPAYTYAFSSTPDADTSLDPQSHAGKGVRIIVNDYLTDATDWWAVADPNMVDTMILGFLGGNENPELFVQDQNNVGSVFTADKISYKIRHIYGGDVGEHRSFFREVVSG